MVIVEGPDSALVATTETEEVGQLQYYAEVSGRLTATPDTASGGEPVQAAQYTPKATFLRTRP